MSAVPTLDWDARYRAERTPWERPSLNPAFLAWCGQGKLSPCRVLLPGQGRSGEMLALAREGFDVVGVDLSAVATAVQRVRLEAAGLPGAAHQADLMKWEPSQPFDAVYDQKCLCALPPSLWAGYAERLHRWLRPGGKLFILLMQTTGSDGPPYPCPPDAMRQLFATGWVWPDRLEAPVAQRSDAHEIPAILTRV